MWSLRELPEPLRPVGTLLALDAIWTRVTDPADRRPRLVVVDEAWLLLQQPAGAQFLLRAAKSGRKHWAGLTVATQDTADVLGTDLGRAVVTNAATQILLRQAPQAIDAVVDTFGLSDGERAFLLSADRGHALLCRRRAPRRLPGRRRRRRTPADHHRPRRTRRTRREGRRPSCAPPQTRPAAARNRPRHDGGCGASMTPPLPIRLLNAVSEAVSAVADFLADIGAWLLDMAMAAPITTVAAVAAAAAVWVGGRCALRRARHRRWLVGARLVTVLAPPRVDPDGAAALWGHLAGLARPGWRRLLFGQPHLSFEYLITPEGSTIRMWVPGPVPPGLVEHAVAAAWPGATTRTNPAEPGASATRDGAAVRDVAEVGDVAAVRGSSTEAGRGGPTVTAGGVLRLARPGGLPIAEDTPGDPVAALLAAPGDLQTPRGPRATDGCGPPGDWVIVQVLARPAAASPVARSRGSVPGGLLGALGAIAVWGVREVLTLITPGPLSASDPAGRGPRTTTAANGEDARTRLARSSGDRAAIAKARGPAFETLIRYAATAVVPDPPPGTSPDPAGGRDCGHGELQVAQRRTTQRRTDPATDGPATDRPAADGPAADGAAAGPRPRPRGRRGVRLLLGAQLLPAPTPAPPRPRDREPSAGAGRPALRGRARRDRRPPGRRAHPRAGPCRGPVRRATPRRPLPRARRETPRRHHHQHRNHDSHHVRRVVGQRPARRGRGPRGAPGARSRCAGRGRATPCASHWCHGIR